MAAILDKVGVAYTPVKHTTVFPLLRRLKKVFLKNGL